MDTDTDTDTDTDSDTDTDTDTDTDMDTDSDTEIEKMPGFPDYLGAAQIVEIKTSGDANGDGTLDAADAIDLASYIVRNIGEGDIDVGIADVNGDGEVDILDLVLLCKVVVCVPMINAEVAAGFEDAGVSEVDLAKWNAAYAAYLEAGSNLDDARNAYAYYIAICSKYGITG
jgi:hypothetical protein